MKLHAYLSRTRHGIYQFRWPLPLEHPTATRKTLRLSLGTRCPHEASITARELAIVGLHIREHLSNTRMDYPTIQARTRALFQAKLDNAIQLRRREGPISEKQEQGLKRILSLLEADRRAFWDDCGPEVTQKIFEQFTEGARLSEEICAEHRDAILDEMRRAYIGVIRAISKFNEDLGTYDFSAAIGAPVTALAPPVQPEPSQTISGAVEAFFREHEATDSWSEGTFQKRRAILDIAIEWFGPDTAMSEIGKREAAAFKSALLALPANRTKVPQLNGMTIREMIAVTDLPKISGATVNAYLSACKVFWIWAEAHGYASEVLFGGVGVGKKSASSSNRRPFTNEALLKVYSALTDSTSKYHRQTSHRWATLIAIFSGARLNEVCQLQLADIIQVDNIWAFDLTDEGSDTKRLKSSAARRRVPVHSHLIELGLLDFVESQARRGATRLFPDYSYTEKHGYGDKLSKWFNRTFTQGLGIKSEAHVFHGLRHTFATRLAQADVPTERIQFIVGHERQGVTHQVYMKEGYTLQQTQDAVERFTLRVD